MTSKSSDFAARFLLLLWFIGFLLLVIGMILSSWYLIAGAATCWLSNGLLTIAVAIDDYREQRG